MILRFRFRYANATQSIGFLTLFFAFTIGMSEGFTFADAVMIEAAAQESQRGILLAQKGEMKAAIEAFERAIQLNPEDGRVYLHLGNAYLETSKLEAAAQACQKAVELLPDFAEAYATLGRVLHRKGELQAAITEYQHAIRLDGEIAAYHYDLGSVYHSLGRLEEAEKEYQATLRLAPKMASVYHNLGEIYQDQGKLDEAIRAYQQSLKLSPEDKYTKARLTQTEQKRKKILEQDILRYQTAISLRPNDPKNYRQLALAYYNNRQLEEAIESLRIALYLQPDSEQARYDLESVLQQKETSLKTVLEGYLAQGGEQSENPDVHYTIGLIYLSKGKLPLAAKHFRQTLKAAPTFASAWQNLGEALQVPGEREAAREAFQQAMRFQPDLLEAHQQLGILEKEMGHLDAAMEQLQRANQIAPDDAKTHYHLGEVYHQKKQFDLAMTEYHTAIRLKPDTVLAYLRLAEVYENKGNRQTALNFYQRFIGMAGPRPELHQQMQAAEAQQKEIDGKGIVR